MRAAVITRPGGPEVLEIRDVPRPLPREHEVLVRVHASALNRADLLQRAGRYPAPPGAPTDIPGLEIAGEVVDVGTAVRAWKAGDRVFGIVGGGGNAEFAVVHEEELARVPSRLSWTDAAAVPEAFITAHDALVTQARMQRGERAIVHAVGSGVGLAATQLIRAIGGTSFGTARTPDKVERARDLGLDAGAAIADPASIPDLVREWSGSEGANVALDLVGGGYFAPTIEAMAPRGRIVLIGLMAGRSATVNLGTVLSRRIEIRGTVMRTRGGREKADTTAAFARDVLPLLESGAVRPVVHAVLPLARIAEAHALLEGNQAFGKVVLAIDA